MEFVTETDKPHFFGSIILKEGEPPKKEDNFTARKTVVDGQQRLTSLYLGLKGSYAYKMPRKRWKDEEENMPTRYLYLILNHTVSADDERNMEYNFKFLSLEDIKKFNSEDIFLVSDIYKYQDEEDLDNFVEDLPITSKAALRKLRKVIFDDQLINFY